MGLVASVTMARPAEAHRAYVANSDSKDVSVIDTEKYMVVSEPIKVGLSPNGVAVNPDGKKAQCHRIIRVRWACCSQNGRCIRLCHEGCRSSIPANPSLKFVAARLRT
jgi:YVTN family beta-propeller protein